jgi:hyperosmotically inducible periplasmic protein
MRVSGLLLSLVLLGTTFGGCVLSRAQDQQDQVPSPDNSKINQRDRNSSQVTAGQQKENRSDRETAKKIRRALVEDKSLSTYAHNIKIISRDGKVTLKGPVRTDEEKQAIEAKAKELAGSDNVSNELQVAGENQNK